MDVAKEVAEILVETLCVGPSEVYPTATLRDDLGADSMDMVSVCQALEEQYEIYFDDSDGDAMKTVADVVKIVEEKLAAKGVQ